MTTELLRVGPVVAYLVVAAAATGCRPPTRAAETATAREEWSRTYPIASAGEFQLVNTNGSIEVDGTNRTDVDVRAERIAHATTDQAARDLLGHISISETVDPAKVVIETQRIKGVLIGVSFEVRYHVSIPSNIRVTLRTANGPLTVSGLDGRTSLTVANGTVTAHAMSGSVEARSTNGNVNVEMQGDAGDFIDLRSINGRIDLLLPKMFKGSLSATCINGRAQVSDIDFENFDEPGRDGRRLRGRINGGGPPIGLTATNGSIVVRGYE